VTIDAAEGFGPVRETRLDKAVAELAERISVKIVLDEKSLNEERIQIGETVKFRISNISAHASLNLLLEPHDLTYWIDQDRLVVSTNSTAWERSMTRTYPVADLCQTPQRLVMLKELMVFVGVAWD
jgi:hypothetical protein